MDFEARMRGVEPKLRQIALRYAHRYPFCDHEDLLSEMLTHLWECSREGGMDDKTDSYIVQACYFHIRNYLRRTGGKPCLLSLDEQLDDHSVAVEGGLRLTDVIPDGAPDLQEAAAVHDDLDRIRERGLSAKEQQVLRYLYEGFTLREIGDKLAVSHVMVNKYKKSIVSKVTGNRETVLV